MVFELIRDLLVDSLGCNEADITMTSDLFDDLGMEYSDLNDIVAALSVELGFSPEAADWSDLTTVGDFVAQVERLA